MSAGNKVDLARKMAVMKTIPNSYKEVAVSASAGKVDLADLGSNVVAAGAFVRLKAHTGDITLLRGDATGTISAGNGLVLAEGEEEEFFVDPDADTELTHISDGASKKLHILFDTEQVR